MTDQIKGLKMVKNEGHPALSTSAKNPDYNKKPGKHPVMPKPKQAKASKKPAKANASLKAIKIADESPESDRARGRDCGLDGKLNNLRKDTPSKSKGTSRRQRRSQRSGSGAALGFNDVEIGAASGFLRALVSGSLNTPDQAGSAASQIPVSPSVPAYDGPRRSGGIPITRGRGQ